MNAHIKAGGGVNVQQRRSSVGLEDRRSKQSDGDGEGRYNGRGRRKETVGDGDENMLVLRGIADPDAAILFLD
jgi:hypothetical protein